MIFSVHTFETNPEGHLGFAFSKSFGEGQNLYFLAKFHPSVEQPQVIAETIFGSIIEAFKISTESEIYDKFEGALKIANQKARQFSGLSQSHPEMVVAFFDFQNLYLSQTGESETYLIRNASVSQISENPEKSEDLFLNLLSGQVQIDDIVLLSSHRILRVLTSNELASIFGRQDFSESIQLFRQKLSQDSEEDILVTAIGVGKSGELPHSGFLSKVLSTKKTILKQKSKFSELKNKKAESTQDAKTREDESDQETREKTLESVAQDHLEAEAGQITSEKNTAQDRFESAQSKNHQGHTQKISVGERVLFWKQAINNFFKKFASKIILLLVIILLLILGKWFLSYDRTTDADRAILAKLGTARESMKQAEDFLLQQDKISAKEQLNTAQNIAKEVLNSKTKKYRTDVQMLMVNINSKLLEVENATTVHPKLLANLKEKNGEIESIGILGLRDNFYVYDQKNLYKTIRSVVEKGVELSETAKILIGTRRRDQNTLVFLSETPQIIEYKDELVTPMKTLDEKWKTGVDIKTYSRFLYILDAAENQIWKYERKRTNYSTATAYNQDADLSRSVSFAIDGSIYVLSDDGKIQRIFQGESIADYNFRELPSLPLSGPHLKIYASPDIVHHLFVLDPDNERVLIFEKGEKFATYKRQIYYNIPDVRDFIIDDAGQKVTLVTQTEIYEFSL